MPDDELIQRSDAETDRLRESVYVGVGRSYDEAIEVAWALAQQKGATGPMRIKVIEHTATGVNPVNDHKVTIILGGSS
jgi:hypothetical protein